MSDDRKPSRPTPRGITTFGDAMSGFLEQAGIAERVEQANAVSDWATIVGPQISGVTVARSVTADGTLFVGVRTNAWMNELSLMEPELLRKLNVVAGRAPIKRIRYVLG